MSERKEVMDETVVPFNANQHLVNIAKKGQKPVLYLQTKFRMMWLRHMQSENHINLRFGIETEIVEHLRNETMLVSVGRGQYAKTQEMTVNCALIKATIRDADGRILAQDYKQETSNDHPDYLEKAITGSIGRALAQLGYGTQWAMEFDGEVESDRLADAPVQSDSQPVADVDRKPTPQQPNTQQQKPTNGKGQLAPAQANAILSMMKGLGITQSAFIDKWGSLKAMDFDQAENVIKELNQLQRDAKQAKEPKQPATGQSDDGIPF